MSQPLTEQQIDDYAILAITADHTGERIDPAVVTVLVDEVRKLQQQRRFLLAQLAKKDARSGDGDRALREFLSGDTADNEPQPSTPLTDDRNPANSREPILWNDAAGNLLSIYPDCMDDEDRPTVALEVREPIFNGFFHVNQAEVPRLAADLCAAAGFRQVSETLLAADDVPGGGR